MDIERRILGRVSGPAIVIASLAIGLCGVGPLLLYVLFGPADGNPIGLGLLAVVALPIAGVALAVGLIKTAVELLLGRRR
jgi:hypothetical protein